MKTLTLEDYQSVVNSLDRIGMFGFEELGETAKPEDILKIMEAGRRSCTKICTRRKRGTFRFQ